MAAPPDRIPRPVDSEHVRVVAGNLHRLAAAQYDQGPVDPGMRVEYMQILTKPSGAQQADLDQLLADQQNPSSKNFHKWLTPEEFGDRFGLSRSDHTKIVAWLQGEGFTINELARGRNWVAFSGTADQVSKSLHTSIHHYRVKGEKHFANATAPSVPDSLADVVAGFIGLNDFNPKPLTQLAPEYNAGSAHDLAPADLATIYNITPLYQAGLDGTGTGIAVVGGSNVLLSDLATFRKSLNLSANVPKIMLYGGSDPGYTNDAVQHEGTVNLEWAGALAPQTSVYYVYGSNKFSAIVSAINSNYGPVLSISIGGCEVDFAVSGYRSIMQQGNAQGITIVAAAGNSGAAGCDPGESSSWAEFGENVDWPAAIPEVTGVGGTMFVEGTGTYWGASNNPSNFGSALSYIPEAAWNETNTTMGQSLGLSGLLSGGGGASRLYPRPAWQTGPGVPNDNARHVPDIALSAAEHDGYLTVYLGAVHVAGGTSFPAPAMAGITALLNQYQVKNGFQAKPGLGNINPQLYRLAQSTPSVFHDIIAGDNVVPCGQGSPDCLTGSFGYTAGPGYDMATGLGSIDANALVTQWNTATQGVTVTLSTSNAKPNTNNTVQLSASVLSAGGTGTPTGTVSFSAGVFPLGSAALAADGTASVTFPAYLIGIGAITAYAEYSGDAAFSSGGAGTKIQIGAPSGAASIIPSAPNTVWPSFPDSQGLSWQTTLTLNEVAGVAAMLMGFTIDGQAQPLSQYFPAVNIVPRGSITGAFVLRNLATPLTHTYDFTGTDAAGQTWSRQVAVNYASLNNAQGDVPQERVAIAATPALIAQDITADPGCQWPAQIHLDDLNGYFSSITALSLGDNDISSQTDSIFGNARVDAYGSISGTICFGGMTPGATQTIHVVVNYLGGNLDNAVTVTFAGPPSSPAKITATPAGLTLAAPTAGQPAQATLAVGLSDKTQPWTASIFPANRLTSWLSVSRLSGVGPAQLSLTASGAGFEPGAYRANIVLQCIDAIPQSVTVPVMFVYGGSTSGTVITGVANSITYGSRAAPGMLLTVFGSNLANSTTSAQATVASSTSGLAWAPLSTAGVSATVNGSYAPVAYISPNQVNLQVPYEAGAGPAVLSLNNNGQVAGFQFNISPSAPGIFADSKGNLVPKSTAAAGGNATLYLTGEGDNVFGLASGYWFATPTTGEGDLIDPLLPLSVAVGGVPGFLQYFGRPSGMLGASQVSFTVPVSLTPGVYPVVVTVGGVASPPVNLTVTQ